MESTLEAAEPTLHDVEEADRMRGDAVRRTPLVYSSVFSKLAGSQVYLKSEYEQKTGSFKIRGAHHKIRMLSAAEKSRGVVAASAGNHAQGVAYAAFAEGIPCTIVMPKTASPAKVAATRGYGANVVLEGSNYEESHAHAISVSKKTGATLIHAFDDPHIIAAQGVVGLEILDELPDVDEIYVPVGGGGLAAGIAIAAKGRKPSVRVVGVQSSEFPSMKASLEAGHRSQVEGGRTIADGISVKSPGQLTFQILRSRLDEMVTVDDRQIIKTMFLLMERSKTVVEPAGAAPLAYLQAARPAPGKKVVAILGGGNVDMYLLGQIVDKGLVSVGRLLKVEIVLKDKPGALKDVVDEITAGNANIVEVVHDRISVDAGYVSVTLSLETEGSEYAGRLIEQMREKGIQFRLL